MTQAQKDARPESLNSLGGLPNVNNEQAGGMLPKEKVTATFLCSTLLLSVWLPALSCV